MHPCNVRLSLSAALVLMAVVTGCETGAGTREGPILYPDAAMVGKEFQKAQPRVQFFKTFSSSADVEISEGGLVDFLVGEDRAKKVRKIGRPYGIVAVPGRILVCDFTQSRVVVLDLKNNKFREIGRGVLKSPTGITADPSTGMVYVSDTGTGHIVMFDRELAYEGRLALEDPGPPPPKPDAEGLDDEPGMGPKKKLPLRPVGMLVHKDLLYVCDLRDNEVKVFHKKTGRFIRRFGQDRKEGENFAWPTHIALGAGERLYVTDTLAAKVYILSLEGKSLESLGGLGLRYGQFTIPRGIALGRTGIVYVADARIEKVQMFTRDKEILMFFPSGPVRKSGRIELPIGVAVSYDNLDYFQKYVAPGFRLVNLILVTSQQGPNKVNVYGLVIPLGAPDALEFRPPKKKEAESSP